MPSPMPDHPLQGVSSTDVSPTPDLTDPGPPGLALPQDQSRQYLAQKPLIGDPSKSSNGMIVLPNIIPAMQQANEEDNYQRMITSTGGGADSPDGTAFQIARAAAESNLAAMKAAQENQMQAARHSQAIQD